MSRKYWAALITALIGIGYIYYFMAVISEGGNYRSLGGAIVMFFEMVILLITGLILVSISKTKDIGQGVLIGSAVTFLIGFGICSSV